MCIFKYVLALCFLFCNLCIVGCTDRSASSYENLKYAINNELKKQIVSIPIVGSSINEGTTDLPFIIVDPSLKGNKQKLIDKHLQRYLDRLVKYARTLERAEAVKLSLSKFNVHKNFVGTVNLEGYIIEYNPDITRTMSVTPYYGISSAKVANLEVRDFVKTTNAFIEDTKLCIDVTFNVKLTNLISCVDDDVLLESTTKEVIGNTQMVYRLYLDTRRKEWRVLKSQPTSIDPVKTLYKRLISDK